MWKSFTENWPWFLVGFVPPLAAWWIFCLAYPAWSKRRSRSRLRDRLSFLAGQLDPDGFPLPKPLSKSQLSPSRSLSPTGTISQSLLDSLEESAGQMAAMRAKLTSPPYATTPTAYINFWMPKSPSNPSPTKYVYGFRGWHLDVSADRKWDVTGKTVQESSLKLLPSNKHYGEWFPGANEAVCRQSQLHVPTLDSPHRAGASGCSCGFWCLHRLSEVAHNVPRPQPMSDGGGPAGLNTYTVWGSIVGWGQCTRQGNGWRCERAQVVAFMDVPVQRVGLPQIVWGTAVCLHCGKTAVGTTAAGTAETSYRPTLSHDCSVNGNVQLYPEVGSKEFIYTADTPLRAYRERLKLLSERFDVPLVAEADLEAFTEKTAKAMYEMYEDSDSV